MEYMEQIDFIDESTEVQLDEDKRRSLEREFTALLKQYDNVIVHSLYKFKFFKTREDQEEYLQEVYLALWKTFIKCRQKGPMELKTMPAWIMGVAKYAIYSYRRNLHRKQDSVTHVDNDYFFEAEDTPYEEGQISAVKLMVSRLPDSDKSVIEMFLDEKNLKQESLKIGMYETYFANKFHQAVKRMRQQAGRYFENYKFDLTNLFVRADYHGRSRAVLQLDADGRILNEYISVTEAAVRSGISRRTIQRLTATEGGGFHSGFFWKYKEGPVVEITKGDKTLALVV